MEQNNQNGSDFSLTWFIRAVLMLGAVLIGVGGLLFVYSHWATFDRAVKVGVFTGSSLISLLLGSWLVFKRQQFEKTGHALCFLSAVLWVVGAYWAWLLYPSLNDWETYTLLAQLGVLVSLLIDPLILTGMLSLLLAFLWSGSIASWHDFAFTSVAIIWLATGSLWRYSRRFSSVGKLFYVSGALASIAYLWERVVVFSDFALFPHSPTVYAVAGAAILFAVGRLIIPVLRMWYEVAISGVMLITLATVGGWLPEPGSFSGGMLMAIAVITVLYGFQQRRRAFLWSGVGALSFLILFFMEAAIFLPLMDGAWVHRNWYVAGLLLLGALWLTAGSSSWVKASDETSARGLRSLGLFALFFACWEALFDWRLVGVFTFPLSKDMVTAYHLKLLVYLVVGGMLFFFERGTTLPLLVKKIVFWVGLWTTALMINPTWLSYPSLYLIVLLGGGVWLLREGMRSQQLSFVYGGLLVWGSPLLVLAYNYAYHGLPFMFLLFGLGMLLFSQRDRAAVWSKPLMWIGGVVTLFFVYILASASPAILNGFFASPVRSWLELIYFVALLGALVYLAGEWLHRKRWRFAETLALFSAAVPFLLVTYTFFYHHFALAFLETPLFSVPVLSSFWVSLIFNIALMCAGLFIAFWGIKQSSSYAVAGGGALCAFLLVSQLLAHIEFDYVGPWLVLYGLAFSLLLSRAVWFVSSASMRKGMIGLSSALGLGCLYILTFAKPLHQCAQGVWGNSLYVTIPHLLVRSIIIPFGLIAAMVSMPYMRKLWDWVEQILCVVLLLFCLMPFYGNSLLFTNSCFVVASCVLIGRGMERENLGLVGGGLLALLILFISRFADHFWSTLSRSIFFMACGLFFLLLGAFFEWQRNRIEKK